MPLVLVTGPTPKHKGFMSIKIHNGVQASVRNELTSQENQRCLDVSFVTRS